MPKAQYDAGRTQKKSWDEITEETVGDNSERIRSAVCRRLGISRQASLKKRKARFRKKVDLGAVLQEVMNVRNELPRTGGRKLHASIRVPLAGKGIHIGRDRLFDILRDADLLLRPRRVNRPQHTRFDPTLPVAHNLINGLEINAPNKVLVADVTYIRHGAGFLYLSLVMDLCCKDIVGWHLSETADAAGCMKALRMARRRLPKGTKPIHHSDRGSTYQCHSYQDLLSSYGWRCSMTEVLHCYENSAAERLNGILKQEFFLDQTFVSKQSAFRAVREAIHLYNTKRLHEALGYVTPAAYRLSHTA